MTSDGVAPLDVDSTDRLRSLVLRVPSARTGERLDSFVASECPRLTRSGIQHAISRGQLLVDGAVPSKAGQRVKEGQRIVLSLADAPPPTALPEPIDIDVRYEDEHLFVVHKPAGLVVHPSPGHPNGTLVNGLLYRAGQLPHGEDATRPGIVHRLDLGTSGLMMVARSQLALASLSGQLRQRTARRLYLAVLLGTKLPPTGEFHTPYGRHPSDRLRFSSKHDGGRHAITRYEIVAQSATTSLASVQLETGRTHQIRVHFADAGYPVAGDPLYGGRRPDRSRAVSDYRAVAGLERQALHAAGLAFVHPATGEWMRFLAPLPNDLAKLAETLYGGDGKVAVANALASWVSLSGPSNNPQDDGQEDSWDEVDE